MTIELIEKHYHFKRPGVQSDMIEVPGKILKGTALLRAIEPSFPSGKDHHLKRVSMQVLNPVIVNGKLKYSIDFFLSDNSGSNGTCNLDVLVILDVDSPSSLAMSTHTVTFPAPGDVQVRVPFYNTVRSCCGLIQGFDVEFTGGVDHHVETFGIQILRTNIVDGETGVEADLSFNLNDRGSGEGRGSVSFVVLADLRTKGPEEGEADLTRAPQR